MPGQKEAPKKTAAKAAQRDTRAWPGMQDRISKIGFWFSFTQNVLVLALSAVSLYFGYEAKESEVCDEKVDRLTPDFMINAGFTGIAINVLGITLQLLVWFCTKGFKITLAETCCGKKYTDYEKKAAEGKKTLSKTKRAALVFWLDTFIDCLIVGWLIWGSVRVFGARGHAETNECATFYYPLAIAIVGVGWGLVFMNRIADIILACLLPNNAIVFKKELSQVLLPNAS